MGRICVVEACGSEYYPDCGLSFHSSNSESVTVKTTIQNQLKLTTAEFSTHDHIGNNSENYIEIYPNETVIPIEKKNYNIITMHEIDLHKEESKSKEQNIAPSKISNSDSVNYDAVGPKQLQNETWGQILEQSGQITLTSPKSQQLGQISEHSGQITQTSPKSQQLGQISEQSGQITLTSPKEQSGLITLTTPKSQQLGQISDQSGKITLTSPKSQQLGQISEQSGQITLTSPKSQQLGQISEQSGQITLTSPKSQQLGQISEQSGQITLATPKSQQLGQISEQSGQITLTSPKSLQLGQMSEQSGKTTQTSPKSQQLGQISEQSGQITLTSPTITLTSPTSQQLGQISEQPGKIILTSPKSRQEVTHRLARGEVTSAAKNSLENQTRDDTSNNVIGIIRIFRDAIHFFKDYIVGKRETYREDEKPNTKRDVTKQEEKNNKQEVELPVLKTNSSFSSNSFSNFSSDLWTNDTVSIERRSYGGKDFVFRVVKGSVATVGEVPYQIGFMTRAIKDGTKIWYSFCGGTLIKDDAVLSAGHCFHTDHWTDGWCAKKDLSAIRARYYFAVAEFLKTTVPINYLEADGIEGQWRRLRYVTVHPDHFYVIHDVAVAFTEKPFTLNSNVAVIPMASVPKDYALTCKASGYGLTQRPPDREESAELRTANLRLLTKKECMTIHGSDSINYICTSDEASDIAEGDSGGPLVCKDTNDPSDKDNKGVVVGIACSYTHGLKSSTRFLRITAYRKFIDQALNSRGVIYSLNRFCCMLCLLLYTCLL